MLLLPLAGMVSSRLSGDSSPINASCSAVALSSELDASPKSSPLEASLSDSFEPKYAPLSVPGVS